MATSYANSNGTGDRRTKILVTTSGAILGTPTGLIGSPATQVISTLAGNTTAYAYYRLLGVSGTTSSSPNSYEMEFQISPRVPNANGTSYFNSLGAGNRPGITVTGTIPVGGGAGNLALLVDGAFGSLNPYINNPVTAGMYCRFDFATAQFIDEFTIYYNHATDNYSTFKWQGSLDSTTWVDVTGLFTMVGIGIVTPALSGHRTAYRYYQFVAVGGAAYSGDGPMQEAEFRISPTAPGPPSAPSPLGLIGTIGGVGKLVYEQAAIPANAALSTGIDTQGRAVCGIIMPASWDAAALRWYAGLSSLLQPVYDNAAARLTTKVAAGEVVTLPTSSVFFAPGIQFESCDAAGAAAVNQSADRSIIIILREVL